MRKKIKGIKTYSVLNREYLRDIFLIKLELITQLIWEISEEIHAFSRNSQMSLQLNENDNDSLLDFAKKFRKKLRYRARHLQRTCFLMTVSSHSQKVRSEKLPNTSCKTFDSHTWKGASWPISIGLMWDQQYETCPGFTSV